MVANLWFFYALGSAILWGFSYALSEKVLKNDITPIFLMVISGFIYLAFSLVLALFNGQLKNGLNAITNNSNLLFEIVVISVSYVVGTFLIYMAINMKNASMANLIEISFPIFTIIFAYFIMKEVQVNMASIIGGLLIFSGIGVIYLKA